MTLLRTNTSYFGNHGFLLRYFTVSSASIGLCIKPVTEPNRTEPTEITEHIRPNLRKLSNIRTGPMAIMIFRYRELTALPVKMTKI